MKQVFLLMILGAGDNESAWEVSSVYNTLEGANAKMEEFQRDDAAYDIERFDNPYRIDTFTLEA